MNNKVCEVNVTTRQDMVEVVEKLDMIEAYIVGCVKNPGTYEIEKNTTIKKLAEIAGGFTENADLEKINLVYKLRDNTMVVIKEKKKEQPTPEEPAMRIVRGIYQEKDDDKDVIVNINIASKEMLTQLPGIGVSAAKKIVKYREENGPFEKIEDLMNIPGIGENKLDAMKDMIVID